MSEAVQRRLLVGITLAALAFLGAKSWDAHERSITNEVKIQHHDAQILQMREDVTYIRNRLDQIYGKK